MQSRQPADLLIEARWVLPVAPRCEALPQHAVAVADGRILALGPTALMRERFAPRERVVRGEHALLPGFVNAHTEAALVLLRGQLPEAQPALPLGVADAAREPPSDWMSAELVRDGTRLALAQMLRAGITCVASDGAFPEETARVLSAARMRASIGLPIAHGAGAGAAEVGAQLASAERLWDEYRASPWLNLHFAPGDSVALTEAALARVRTVADELDARIAMPVHASRAEIELSVARAGVRPLERLAALGLLRPGFLALHMNQLDGEDLELAARTGISVVTCPQAGLYQGHGASPLRELLERGVPVGLGSGSPAHAGALDLLAEARTAALVAGSAGAPALDAEAVLRLATLGGAMALGLAAVAGSIEPGKAADLITIDVGALSSQGGTQPAEAVLYGATREHVSDVWLSGNAAVSQGRLLAFDEQELSALRRSWSERLNAPWSASYAPAQARLGDWQ